MEKSTGQVPPSGTFYLPQRLSQPPSGELAFIPLKTPLVTWAGGQYQSNSAKMRRCGCFSIIE
jgi:hypothetical protein